VLLDPVERTYSFVGGPGAPQGYWYLTLDIDSGAVVSIAPINDWFNHPEYDPVTGSAFALRWARRLCSAPLRSAPLRSAPAPRSLRLAPCIRCPPDDPSLGSLFLIDRTSHA
jgi:hypothetical protein